MARIQSEMKEVMMQEKKSQQMLKMHLGGLDMGLTKCILGHYLELCSNKNTDLVYGIDDVRGVNNLKQLMTTKADLNGRDLSKFQIVNPGEFVFNHRTSRNGSKFSIAYNDAISLLFVQKIMLYLKFVMIVKKY